VLLMNHASAIDAPRTNFSLDIPPGRFVSIFGPNGCGKSMLINLMGEAGSTTVDMQGGSIAFVCMY
jgi:ABC-type lipoprotein export system ATPase subunit